MLALQELEAIELDRCLLDSRMLHRLSGRGDYKIHAGSYVLYVSVNRWDVKVDERYSGCKLTGEVLLPGLME